MLGAIKRTTFDAVMSLGGYKILQLITGNMPKLLVYHRFGTKGIKGRLNGELFEKQLQLLIKRFKIIPLSDAVKMIKGTIPIVKNAVVITVDDGYRDFYTVAYPILKKYNLPATIYVTSNFIDKKIWLWPDRITYALSVTKQKTYVLRTKKTEITYYLEHESYYGDLWKKLVKHCLSISDDEKKKFLLGLEKDLDVEMPLLPPEDYSAIDWDELYEMSKNGIEIGAHTSTHPSLSQVNQTNLEYEITGCKKLLEQKLNASVNNFCYPNGMPGDYNNDVIEQVRAAGFKSATVAFFDSKPFKGIYELRRYGVGENMRQFHKVIYGVELLRNKIVERKY